MTGGDFSFDFFQLSGDTDRNMVVGFSDLVAVAQHYGASGLHWSDGDVTGDGNVDFVDLVVVAQHYGTNVAPPSAAPAHAPVMAPRSSTPLKLSAAATKPVSVAKPVIMSDPKKKPTGAIPVFSQRRVPAMSKYF